MSLIQLHINRINLPFEMLDIIKSYLFYDKKTYNIIQNIKLQKQLINKLFIESVSRANRFDNFLFYSDNDEHWMFGFGANHPTEDLQLQAMNCYCCGNYVHHYNNPNDLYSNNIYCICQEYAEEPELDNQSWNTDDLYSHDNSDDNDTDGYDSN